MLYREIIVVCSEIHTKHINTQCGQNAELLNVHIVTTGLQRMMQGAGWACGPYPKHLTFAKIWTNIPWTSRRYPALHTPMPSRFLRPSLVALFSWLSTRYWNPQFITTFKNSCRVQVRTFNIVTLQDVWSSTLADRWHPKQSARQDVSWDANSSLSVKKCNEFYENQH